MTWTAREILDGVVPIRDAYEMLAPRVEAVLALHKCVTGEDGKWKWCDVCGSDDDPTAWPCPTVRALNGSSAKA